GAAGASAPDLVRARAPAHPLSRARGSAGSRRAGGAHAGPAASGLRLNFPFTRCAFRRTCSHAHRSMWARRVGTTAPHPRRATGARRRRTTARRTRGGCPADRAVSARWRGPSERGGRRARPPSLVRQAARTAVGTHGQPVREHDGSSPRQFVAWAAIRRRAWRSAPPGRPSHLRTTVRCRPGFAAAGSAVRRVASPSCRRSERALRPMPATPGDPPRNEMTVSTTEPLAPAAASSSPDAPPVDPAGATPAGRTPAPRGGPQALALRLHFYAGVFVAPFILVAAVTGALYAIAPTLEQIVSRDLLTVEAAGTPRPLSEQVDAATAVRPDLPLVAVSPAPGETDT